MCVGARGRGKYTLGAGFRGASAFGSNGGTSTGVPKFGGSSEGHIYVAHREYLGEVTTGGDPFTTFGVYPLNPGMSQTFPWLSSIAANFEEYEFNGLIFEFVSHSANALNSTDTALGAVMMATQYNANSAPFSDKASMMQYDKTVSGKPSVNIVHAVECARRKTVLPEMFVRTGPVVQTATAPQDMRMYDWGKFQLSTQGMQDPCTLGELWVTYSVTLRKPKLPGSYGSATIPMGWYTFQNQAAVSMVGKPSLTFLDTTYQCPLIGDYSFSSADWGELQQYDTTGILLQNVGTGTAATRSTQFVFNNSHVGKYYRIYINWTHASTTAIWPVIDTTGSSKVSGVRCVLGNGDSGAGFYGPPVTYSSTTADGNGGVASQLYSWWSITIRVDAPDPALNPPYPVLNVGISPAAAYGVNGVGCPIVSSMDVYITEVPGEMVGKYAVTPF